MKNTYKILVSIIIFFSLSSNLKAQELKEKNNAVFLEFFGSAGSFYNLSYDRKLISKGKDHSTMTFGFQFYPQDDRNLVSISPQINYLRGNINHLELGIGFIYNFHDNTSAIPIRIGYRYQSNENNFFFRIGFTPLLLLQDTRLIGKGLFPWGGGAFGVTF